jgi:hypothetical protein
VSTFPVIELRQIAWHNHCLLNGDTIPYEPRSRRHDAEAAVRATALMALISFSDWLDRFGDTAPGPTTPVALESLRFAATEAEAPRRAMPRAPGERSLGRRLQLAWRRTLWRLKRQPSGSA